MFATQPTAALIVIGNEVLSGRTQDLNVSYIGERCAQIGILLREVRIVPDEPAMIITTVNELRPRYTHVFTTGGIGPTHDDITSECVAAAFGVPWERHDEAWGRMERAYPPGEFNAARQRMATMPRGARLIDNPISTAPGFTIGNVHVLAGIPRIAQAMFEQLAPHLQGGSPILSRAMHAQGVTEGLLAGGLAQIQARYPNVELGSYPFYRASGNGVAIVGRGTDLSAIESAMTDVMAMLGSIGATVIPGEPLLQG